LVQRCRLYLRASNSANTLAIYIADLRERQLVAGTANSQRRRNAALGPERPRPGLTSKVSYLARLWTHPPCQFLPFDGARLRQLRAQSRRRRHGLGGRRRGRSTLASQAGAAATGRHKRVLTAGPSVL